MLDLIFASRCAMNAKCAQRHHDVEHLQSHRRSIVVLSATHERVLVVVDLSLYSALPPGWLSPPPCAGELAGQDAPCRSQALAPPTVCAPCLALLALSGHDRVWASLATARELDGHPVRMAIGILRSRENCRMNQFLCVVF